MKKLLVILLVCLSANLVSAKRPARLPAAANRADAIAALIHNPKSNYVLVASHRGDWRNYPENSLGAIRSVIRMGVDIMELDLKLTRDSVLVLCHDGSIDRTTTGHGQVCDITYDSISRCKLKSGHGVKTTYKMPTLREALAACKDHIVVNIDQGYEYYDLALAICEELGVTDQVLIKGKRATDIVAAKFAQYPHNMMYMPIIDILTPNGAALFGEYQTKHITPLAYEVCWNTYTPEVKACMEKVISSGSKLWVNSLWPSLCAGLCDDVAFEGDLKGTYGKLVGMGATIIQTDRPQLLIDYLKSRKLHE